MKLKISAPSGQWIRETSEAGKIAATGLTKAMRETGKLAAAAANRNIHAAGFVSRKWELRPKNYPASGVSLLPEVWLHSRVNFEDIFEEGRTIHGNPGWLWLPLPSVPKWPDDSTRQMSPKKYRESIGPLVSFLHRAGKTPILAAVVRGLSKPQPWGRFATRARLNKGRAGKGAISYVPMFVGVKTVTIEKRFDVMAAVESVTDKMEGLYAEYEGKS